MTRAAAVAPLRSTVLLLVLGSGAGCASIEPDPGPSIRADRLLTFVPDARTTLLHTDQSGLANPTLAVVHNADAWRAMWTAARAVGDTAAQPAINFVFYSVVVVGLGRRAGAGYSVDIDSIIEFLDGAVVYATETHTSATCGGAAATAQPVHMVVTPWHPRVTDWRVRAVIRGCGG